MLPEIFQKAIPVLELIESHGYEAYFVGGCVRDVLLHRNISDVDIATNATPEEIKEIFNRTVDVGIEHGTVMVLYGKEKYEITTFRTESTYHDFRRPDKVEFVRNLQEDLKRRDITINAMAMDKNGKLQDFHQGLEHLNKKIIQAVGNANERFFEDALRMMRAVRFSSQLGFQISEETTLGILSNKHLLEKIAIERVVVELEKLLSAPYRNMGLESLINTQLYENIPFLKDNKETILSSIAHHKIYEETCLNYTLLLYGANIPLKKSREILKQLKLSNLLLKEVETLLAILSFRKNSDWHNEFLFDVPEYLAVLGENLAKDLNIITNVEKINELYINLPIKTIHELALNGTDIMMVLNKQQGGSYLGEIIEDIRKKVLNNVLKNDKSVLKNYIIERYGDENAS